MKLENTSLSTQVKSVYFQALELLLLGHFEKIDTSLLLVLVGFLFMLTFTNSPRGVNIKSHRLKGNSLILTVSAMVVLHR